MKIAEHLNWGTRELIAFDSARLDAELLLAHVLKRDLSYLLAHDDKQVGFLSAWKFRRLVARRKKGVPVAYLRGFKEFYGLDFKVNHHVLVPRPDTEILVSALIDYLKRGDLLLDIGTGSACIPIAVLKHVKGVEAVGVEISGPALRVAIANIKKHRMQKRIKLIKSDLLKDVDRSLFQGDRLVVSANLPYVPREYQVNVEAGFEPQLALYGGDDGLDAYLKLAQQLEEVRPRAIFFECFEFQVAMIAEHLASYELKTTEAMGGEARMLMLERKKG